MHISELLGNGPNFLDTMGPTVVSVDHAGAVLRLDAGPELFNHLGGPHAAIIFGLGETAAFAMLIEMFGDLLEAGAVPLVGKVEIGYSDIATGPLLAEAGPVQDEAGVRTRFAERGSASFPVDVVFRRETDGVETARATYKMAVKRL